MEETVEKKKFRWGRLVLGLSLALNLAVLGIVGGALWRLGGHDDRGRNAHGSAFAAPYVRALSREDRQALRTVLQSRAPRDGRAQRSAHYAAVLAALRSEPFDKDAVAKAISAQRGVTMDAQKAAEEAWLERVSSMDAQARNDYAMRIEDVLSRRKGRKDNNRDK